MGPVQPESRSGKQVADISLQQLPDICARHFEDKMFVNTATRSSLIWSAVPTIFDIPNCPPAVTSVAVSLSKISTVPHCTVVH